MTKGFRSMTAAFNFLSRLHKHNLIHTYVLEMVACGVRKPLTRWAMSGARKGVVAWDYLIASSWLCPSQRERFILKPRIRGYWHTPRPLQGGESLPLGEAIGFPRSKGLGLLGGTWTPEWHLYRSMEEICFTITGNMPILCSVEDGRVERELRRLTCVEQMSLMGFPPTILKLVKWCSLAAENKRAKMIGAGWCFHMGLAIAESVKVSMHHPSAGRLAEVIRAVNLDFRARNRGKRRRVNSAAFGW